MKNRNEVLYNQQRQIFLEQLIRFRNRPSYISEITLQNAHIDLNVIARQCGLHLVRPDLEYNVLDLLQAKIIYIPFANEEKE